MFTPLNENLNPFSYLNRTLAPNCFSYPQLDRYVRLALPFLNLYQPLARPVAIGSGIIQISGQIGLIKTKRDAQDSIKTPLFQLSLTIASVAGTLLQWRTGLILGASYEVAEDIHLIGLTLLGQSKDPLASQVCLLTRHVIQLCSTLLPSPQMIAIALLSQLIFESYKSWAEWKTKGWTLECFAHLLLLTIHSYQFQQQCQGLLAASSSFKQELSKEETLQLVRGMQRFKQQHPEDPLDFAAFLKDNRYSTHLMNADFQAAIQELDISRNLFSNVHFNSVHFSNCNFENLTMNDVHFVNCELNEINFYRAEMSNSMFTGCRLNSIRLNFSRLVDTSWHNCLLNQVDFTACTGARLIFNKSRLDACQFVNAFILQMSVSYSTWTNCDLELGRFIQAQLFHFHLDRSSGKLTNWGESKWAHCRLSQSKLQQSMFKKAQFERTIFEECDLEDSLFHYSKFTHVHLNQTLLNYVGFHDAELDHMNINHGQLSGTSFLDAKVNGCRIKHSDLTDCLFFETKANFHFTDCTENIITRPIIGIPWNLESIGHTVPMAYKAVKNYQGIPFRLNYLPSDIDPAQLTQEVQGQLSDIQCRFKRGEILSIPDQLFKQSLPGSLIDQIHQRSKHYIDQVDALLLLGGQDLFPFYYGAAQEPETFPDSDYRISLVEFSLAFEAIRKDSMPVVGICRNCQLLNVLLGGSIKQHVAGQIGAQTYQIPEGSFQDLLGPELTGMSMHHQAITLESLAPGLQPLIVYDGIVKAWEWLGHSVWGFQFHPEFIMAGSNLISDQNKNLIIDWIRRASFYRNLKLSGELNVHAMG